ncbi:MAG: hypothetical protein ACRCZB_05015 [Bacteroidales bacterium]
MKRYDYESVLERLTDSVKKKLGGADSLLLFSTNASILEACAEEIADFALYDEYLTREAVWETAKGYSSIMRQVGFYNYKPHRKVGATGVIKVSTSKTFDGTWGKNISLPRFTEFSGGGVTFLSVENSFLGSHTENISLEVIQGIKQDTEVLITPSEFPNLEYATVTILDPSIENTLYEVRVNGTLWKEYPNIRLASSGLEEVFTTKTLIDFSGVEISFGNGVFGKSLQYGDIVHFSYLRTDGSDGNILSSGIISTVNSTITDESGSEVKLYCTNEETLVGGDGYELLADIKSSAPLSFQTGSRAVSSDDYRTLIESMNISDNIQVWGEKELNEDRGHKAGTYVEASENLVYITGFTIDDETSTGYPLTSGAQTLIRSYLNEKKGTTDILQFVDTEIVYVSFYPEVWVSNLKYSSEQVIENVHNILVEQFSIKKAQYKKSLYFSDYYRTVDSAEGVDHHKTTLSFSQFFKFSSAYKFSPALKINNIKPNSVEIFIKNVSEGMDEYSLLAYDNGSGFFMGAPIDPDDPSKGDYGISSATINYEDGDIGDFLVTYGLEGTYTNYNIKISFELSEDTGGDLVLSHRQQLFCHYEDNTIVHLMGVN